MSGKRSRAFRAYQKIKALKPGRSLFDLSHERLMTCDMFKLYVCCAMEMSPGDTFHIANQSVTRLQPLNAPIMASISQNTHYFFVPYRILDENWTEFITGGSEGESGGDEPMEPPEVAPILPRWVPTKNGIGTLWDSFGFPVGVDPQGAYPIDYLRRAYNLIWNEFYRDENHQDPVPLDNEDLLYRDWKKDYFTSALLSQQRGTSPIMPVNGTINPFASAVSVNVPATPIEFSSSYFVLEVSLPTGLNQNLIKAHQQMVSATIVHSGGTTTDYADLQSILYDSSAGTLKLYYYFRSTHSYQVNSVTCSGVSVVYTEINEGVGIEGAGFDVRDLRQAFQIQKWLELANRGGVRYTEFLRAFFGVSPRDDRLQRPEYIGGSKSPIVISEVLQTSSTENEPTPQGYMSGHGLGAERTYIGSYSAQEYGVLIGLLSYTTPPRLANSSHF